MNESKPRGRPKDMDKRAAIVRGAHRLFMARGFEVVKIEEIADEAGVSKMTVYANFPDKASVFQAVVEQQREVMERDFQQLHVGTDRINLTLSKLGQNLLSFLLSPEVMRFDQMLSAAMKNHEGLGERFYQAGPNHIWVLLTTLIRAAAKKGELETDDPKHAAEDLIALWLGNVPLQHRFNEMKPPSNQEINRRVTRGVANFMKIYGNTDKLEL
jgi:TetR/AcrR family transcriptional regulator, mexJK operon transcriptional repressor